jgi:hypothetical protein
MQGRPTKVVWHTARQRWEADPTETFQSIAAHVGVSRQAVCKHAEQEGWLRLTDLEEINERAQISADSKVAQVDGAGVKSVEQAAVDVRANVLLRHRTDWTKHRELFSLEKISEHFETGKQAKISAEMLMLRQRGERDAYGITDTAAPAEVSRSMTDLELASKLAYFVDLGRRRAAGLPHLGALPSP